VFVNLRSWAKYPENSEVQVEKPPFKRRRLGLTCTIFSMATVVAYGGELVKGKNDISSSSSKT